MGDGILSRYSHGLDCWGLIPGRGKRFFLLEPTQPPFQWASVALSLGGKAAEAWS
jgi:hypothetical protein